MSGKGNVYVVSHRAGSRVRAEKGDFVVVIDRTNPVLGNPFPLRGPTQKDRDVCCDLFQNMANVDMSRRGPIWRKVQELALMVIQGKRIALSCWCAPKRCHGDYIKLLIDLAVAQMLQEKHENH